MTEKPDNVRLCHEGEEDRLFCFAMEAHDDNGFFPVNTKKVRTFVECATGAIKTSSNQHYPIFLGIIEENGVIAGSVALEYINDWYTDIWYLGDKWNFVRPDYRRGRNYANDLLNYAKWISEKCNCILGMGIRTEKRLEPKIELYRRRFSQVGAFFMHNLHPDHIGSIQ